MLFKGEAIIEYGLEYVSNLLWNEDFIHVNVPEGCSEETMK